MTTVPPVSDAEWEVMEVLWDRSPRTASEVVDALCTRMDWHPKTVKTLLGRLVRKGALRFRAEGNRYFYRPTVPRDRYVRDESRSFLDRVFGGEATPALLHFVENSELSDADIAELQEILRKKKES